MSSRSDHACANHAVMEVLSGATVTNVATRYGVSRRSVHAWVNRYEESGLAFLAGQQLAAP